MIDVKSVDKKLRELGWQRVPLKEEHRNKYVRWERDDTYEMITLRLFIDDNDKNNFTFYKADTRLDEYEKFSSAELKIIDLSGGELYSEFKIETGQDVSDWWE